MIKAIKRTTLSSACDGNHRHKGGAALILRHLMRSSFALLHFAVDMVTWHNMLKVRVDSTDHGENISLQAACTGKIIFNGTCFLQQVNIAYNTFQNELVFLTDVVSHRFPAVV